MSIGLSFGDSAGEDRPRTLTSAVQERLRADILATRLLPGQKLHIAGLAKQFSTSLAAVREALSRLVADGLVQASDQRGFRVSPVSLADLADVTQTRVDIEGLALRRSIEPGVHYEEWVERHRIFHRALVNACGSQWLLGFRDVLHEQSERYRRLSIRDVSKVRDVETEHAAIVEAALRRDADAAVDALAKHFNVTMRFVEQNAPDMAEVSSFRK
jgi:DNA-binding GntR family transcriptional regulator